jgi:hypothetical protein
MSFWIMADDRPTTPKFYYFTKSFDAPKGASFKVRVCGDSRYALYLNGHLVSEGPCQGSSYQTYFETEDLTPYLKEGENTLFAKVLYVTEGYFISVFRKSRPAFWLDGELRTGCESTAIGTDASWTCEREDACAFSNMPGIHIWFNYRHFDICCGDSF